MSTPKKRSSDPKMARCSMMGCSFSPLLATYLTRARARARARARVRVRARARARVGVG